MLCGFNEKQTTPVPENVATYVNEQNTFFARFESNNFSVEQKEVMHTIRNRIDEQLVIRQEAVMREFKRIRVKALPHDG